MSYSPLAYALLLTLAIVATNVQAQSTPQVLRDAAGNWASDVKTQHFCDQQNNCHDYVFTTDTYETISVDGNLTKGFQASGNGQEIVRSTN